MSERICVGAWIHLRGGLNAFGLLCRQHRLFSCLAPTGTQRKLIIPGHPIVAEQNRYCEARKSEQHRHSRAKQRWRVSEKHCRNGKKEKPERKGEIGRPGPAHRRMNERDGDRSSPGYPKKTK